MTTVLHEPLTYEPDAPHSYFRDLALAFEGNHPGAEARQQRHATEMRTVLAERETRARAAAAAQGVELRVSPSRIDGQGGFGAPPLWLIDQTATAPRPGRALSALMPGFLLPDGVGEVNVPRLTTGTLVGTPADGAPGPGRDNTDAAVTSPVVTFAGLSDVALQLLELSPPGAYLDHAIFADLAADYDLRLEAMLANGSGSGGQFLGVLNVPAGAGLASAVTYTDASPTAAELVPLCAQAAAQLGNARGLGPETWLMRTSRKAWINAAAWPQPAGPLLDYPTTEDNAIPATLGGATPGAGTQDAIVACRPTDMLLLETVPRMTIDLESQSGEIGARLRLLGYAAAFVARYPTAIATITGSGMTVQPGFSSS
jgi:hypothetical protein